MRKFLDKMLSSMPDVETRERNVFFRIIMPPSKTLAYNDFRWILYSSFRSSFIILTIFMASLLFRLGSASTLKPELLKRELYFDSMLSAIPILLAITPYYVTKCLKIIGFSKVNFFSRKVLKPTSEHPICMWDRKEILRRALLLMFMCLAIPPFSYMVPFYLIMNYEAISSIVGISTIVIFCGFAKAFAPAGFIVGAMTYLQYKYHYDEIPNNKTLTERKP